MTYRTLFASLLATSAILTRLIHWCLADAVFWADGARDRASTVTRMDSVDLLRFRCMVPG